MNTFLYLLWPEYENALEEELLASGSKPKIFSYGALVQRPWPPKPAAFARQLLVDPETINGGSIRSIGERLNAILPDDLPSWQFHAFTTLEKGGERRTELVSESFIELLKKKRGRTLKALQPKNPAGGLLQHIVVSPEISIISYASLEQRTELNGLISPFLGGHVQVESDPRPPSRAYLKLVEAMRTFGREIQPQEKVVDLGCSPGGWAWIALQLGGVVTGIDRSNVDSGIQVHPRFSFQTGDAFKFVPPEPVDWLICDVISEPPRTIELLEEWLNEKRIRYFCVTMKFKGEKRSAALDAMRAVLRKHCDRWMLRHLENNGNEATAIGQRKE